LGKHAAAHNETLSETGYNGSSESTQTPQPCNIDKQLLCSSQACMQRARLGSSPETTVERLRIVTAVD